LVSLATGIAVVVTPWHHAGLLLPTARLLSLQPSIHDASSSTHDRPTTLRRFNEFVESFVPASCVRDPNHARRARLVAHFGVQGAIFGPAYAIFYAFIGHFWGSAVIVACSAVFAGMPLLLKRTARLDLTGQVLVGTMAVGFTVLTLIEGGLHGHAIAWLASVPLCALLVIGQRGATVWSIACVLIAGTIAIAAVFGFHLTPFFDPKWTDLVEAAGNLGLIVFLFALGLVFEVSRRRAQERTEESLTELAESNGKLTTLNNEKTEFLGMAAHDLRNPLSVIIGYSELLCLEREQRIVQMAKDIGKGGARMLALVNDLLDANAIEEGTYARKLERCDLSALTRLCMDGHLPAAERKRISLHWEQDGSHWVQADPKAALQILDNLLSNALKYSPFEREIHIRIQERPEWCEWAVQDHGPGISADEQQLLFRKHTRLSAKPTGGEPSVGLGLSIVKRLAETMQGEIGCQSTLGEGSTFILRLRRADQSAG
jgi:signal transduction histidine kinase